MSKENGATPLTFPHVAVVEASAGSGKTYYLAKRYLQLLMDPRLQLEDIPLRNILAITFTNKATVEMKERILELLKKIALDIFSGPEEKKDILGPLGVEKEFARKKARLILDELMKHYNFFQIQTIDSFINALLLGCALNIDRSASFKIKRDYNRYLSYCLDLVIEQAVENKSVFDFLEEFLEHYLFVENRTSWFPKDDILALMQSLFRLGNKYGHIFKVQDAGTRDIIRSKKYIYGQIRELPLEFPEGLNNSAQKSILSFLNKNGSIFDSGSLPSSLQRPVPPMNRGKSAPEGFLKQWRKINKSLREVIELEARVSYSPYVKVFTRLTDFFQLIARKEDVIFLEELNRKARLIFGPEGLSVAEVYYRLATRFKHYLIDEFQDTSILQWDNLFLMVEEALSSGGSLFYVGDKKQAIYRFRGGEVQLFDKVRRKFQHFNVLPEHLTNNWRSQRAIVEFNNKVFSRENLLSALNSSGISAELKEEEESLDEITTVFKDAVQEHRRQNSRGYVYIERLNEKNKAERDSILKPKITGLIGKLRKRFRSQDIAILTRDNNEVELVTSWCLEAGFPVESEKTLNVIENHLIKEVISFLGFLHSPPDDLSFAGFCLGEIFSRATGLACAEVRKFMFESGREKDAALKIPLYRSFSRQFPQVWSRYMDIFFKSVGFVSTYELVASIYRQFKVFENFKSSQAFFMKFLELIKAKEDDYVGLEEFLAYLKDAPLEDLYVSVAHSDSLKILTIHKSKGLEFDAVVIPFLRMDITPETGGKGTNTYVVRDSQGDLSLLRITQAARKYSPSLQEIYARSYKKSCIDELNNIYVALTRAKHELYIFIPQKSRAAKNKASFLIPAQTGEYGRPGQSYARKEKEQAQPFIKISPSTYQDWIATLKEEFGDIQLIRNREKILAGNILHAVLSQVGDLSHGDLEEILEAALKFAGINFPSLKDPAVYQEKIRQLITAPVFKDIFYPSGGQVFCEKEAANKFGDLKRIDRLIVKDDQVLIVDYKTSAENADEHKRQVREYMDIFKDIYPGRKIKGVLVYLDEMEREEIEAD